MEKVMDIDNGVVRAWGRGTRASWRGPMGGNVIFSTIKNCFKNMEKVKGGENIILSIRYNQY